MLTRTRQEFTLGDDGIERNIPFLRIVCIDLLASEADEALVTLTYLPGGDRPARIDLVLDGKPSDRICIPVNFEKLESRTLHALFSAKLPPLIELARWGHQRPGMPWELLVDDAHAAVNCGGTATTAVA